jgi:NADH-quinone oxidoreductase subunit D
MGFHTLFVTCFTLREQVMDVLDAISGNWVNYAMNCIGGVNRDIVDTEQALATAKEIEQTVTRSLLPISAADQTVNARCRGVGVMTRDWGTVGPSARASGVVQDIRWASPYAVYNWLEFTIPVETVGGVRVRIVVCALEVVASYRIIQQAADAQRAFFAG